jgi:hypothetical protein
MPFVNNKRKHKSVDEKITTTIVPYFKKLTIEKTLLVLIKPKAFSAINNETNNMKINFPYKVKYILFLALNPFVNKKCGFQNKTIRHILVSAPIKTPSTPNK